jgi:hypothetical protein
MYHLEKKMIPKVALVHKNFAGNFATPQNKK